MNRPTAGAARAAHASPASHKAPETDAAGEAHEGHEGNAADLAPAADARRGEVVDLVIQRLRDGILEGRFAPGQRLITSELTSDVGVSRGTLREAFQRLAADGMVDLVPNRGAIVRRYTRQAMRDIFRIREALEGLAASLAAETIGAAGNRDTFETMWKEAQPGKHMPDSIEFARVNRLFHRTIVAVGGNQQLSDLIDNQQLPILMLQLARAVPPASIALSMHEHAAIAAAILAGDAERADQAMRTHLRNSGIRILGMSSPIFKS
jgi:DNA-binding GntR family transcriptional regulator